MSDSEDGSYESDSNESTILIDKFSQKTNLLIHGEYYAEKEKTRKLCFFRNKRYT